MSLLEILRQNLVVLNPTTKEESIQKLKFINDHLDEFPTKLRGIIRYLMRSMPDSETTTETYLWTIYLAVREFFLGLDVWESIIGKRLVQQDPTTEEEARQELKLISEYRDSFPLDLQEAIRTAVVLAEEESPTIAFGVIQSAIKEFLSSQYRINNAWEAWDGLDKNSDIEDEAEVAIRMFPAVLDDLRDGRSPTCLLTSSPKAVTFVPLFLHLGSRELRGTGTQPIVHQVPCNFSYVYLQQIICCLLCNNSWNRDGNKKYAAKLDEESLFALIRSREMGLVRREDLFLLLNHLFLYWKNTKFYFDDYFSEHDTDYIYAFFQTRFKLLLAWGPFLIMEYVLNGGFWAGIANFDTHMERVMEPVIETVCSVSLSHFPMELGFMFSQEYYHEFMRPELKSRRQKAQKKIFEIGRKEITKAMRRNNAVIKEWVYAVATNDKIPPDGLYTLIRCNPIGALIPDSS